MKLVLKVAVCMLVIVLLAACSGTENDGYIETDHVEFGLMLAMPEEKFHELRGRLDRMIAAGEFDGPLLPIFANSHTRISYEMLYQDYRSGRMFSTKEITKRYPAFPYLSYIYMLKPVSPRIFNDLLRHYELLGVTVEDIVQVGITLGMENVMDNVLVMHPTAHVEFGLMRALPEAYFYELIEKLQVLVDDGVIDIPTMRIFVNNYSKVSESDNFYLKPLSPGLMQEMLRIYELIGITVEDIIQVGRALQMEDIMDNVLVVQ